MCPSPGVPESFKVLVKELQSLCLDIRVLDENGNEIELRDEDDEDTGYVPDHNETYVTDHNEVLNAGYALDEDQPDDGVMDVLAEIVSDPDDEAADETEEEE